MRKLLTGAVLLALCGLTAVYVTSCAKQAGPLSPSLNLLGSGSDADLVQVDGWSAPSSVSDTAQVTFDENVDPASLTTNTVLIYTQNTDNGATETRYTNYSLSYNAQAQLLTIYPTNGLWDNDKAYRVELTTGIRHFSNHSGLDGNNNQIPESATFDNFHLVFNLGALPVGVPGYSNNAYLWVATRNWNAAGTGSDIDEYEGNIPCSYTYVTLTVQFDPTGGNPPDWRMDKSSFFVDNNTLHPNIVFTTAAGAAVVPVAGTVTIPAWSGDSFSALEAAFVLTPNTQYKFRLRGGLNGIRSSNEPHIALRRVMYLDGNGSGQAEASDDTRVYTLQTCPSDNNLPWPAVQVTGWTYDSYLRRFEVTFNVPAGVGTLDPATIVPNNFRLLNESANPDQPIAPLQVLADNSNPPTPVVYVYVPMLIDYRAGNINRTVRLTVMPEVSGGGIKLDQNGNGVPGDPGDTYSVTQTIQNYRQ